MKIPIISGLNLFGSPLVNDSDGNFIQLYFNNKPYFRAGTEKDYKLLEEFITEAKIKDYNTKKKNIGWSQEVSIPNRKGNLYELVGGGIIREGCSVEKETGGELNSTEFYIVGGYSEVYDLYPSIKHFSKILKEFEYPLIFADSSYLTEEERGFVRDEGVYGSCYDDEDFDGTNFLDQDTGKNYGEMGF